MSGHERLRVGGLVALTLVGLAAGAATLVIQGVDGGSLGALSTVLETLTMPLFAAVGGFVLHRQPGHPLGRFVLALGLLGAGINLIGAVVLDAPLPVDGSALALIASIGNALGDLVFVGGILVLPLIFPDGRLPSSRWRPVGWSLAVVATIGVIGELLSPGPIRWWRDGGPIEVVAANPLGVQRFGDGIAVAGEAAEMAGVLFMVAAIVAVVVRMRRDPVERRQIAWVALALLVGVVAALATAIPAVQEIGSLLSSAAYLSFPLAVGIAVSRYRLFDIDRILTRTVSYALVTTVLVGVYAFGVLGVGALVPGGSSDLLVAASTLAVAAAFQPVRRRVQHAVDRRFSRASYDAQGEVSRLADRLRREVGLDGVVDELATTVDRIVRPSTVSLVLLAGRER